MADGADRKDADLVADVRAGNTASFALLFDRWFGPVLGAAQDLVGVQAEAARVATDTFQSVWLHLDELADPEGFGAWVLLTSRTFARQRQAERDPSAEAPSGPLFENEVELRRAVAKILVRRQVPALGQPVPVAPAAPSAVFGGGGPGPATGTGAGLLTAVPEAATDRLHRYHWAPPEPALSVSERIRSFRLSPGTLVALAIVLLGSLIWLMGRDESSEIDGGRPAPLFSPASPTTIDGAAARSDNGAATPGAVGVAPSSLPPDPVTPAPTEAAAPASSRKVKVAAVMPRSVSTTPARRGATVSAPVPMTPVATVTIAPSPSGTPRTDQPPPTATVAPSSASTTASTARTTTTAEPTTATTARTTTTNGRTTTTTSDDATTTARASTTTRAVTSMTVPSSITTTAPATTRVTTATTVATTAPPVIGPLTD